MRSFLFEESAPAVQAVHDLRGEGIDPRAIRLHLWDDGYCLRVRGPLSPPLASRIEALGGRRVESPATAVADAPLAEASVAVDAPVRRRWWVRRD